MVNGNVDENNTCTSLNPDEGNVKHQDRKDDNAASSSDSTDSSLPRKLSNVEEASPTNGQEKSEVGDAFGSVPSTTTLLCSVPLTKIRAVSGGKIEDDENSKIRQTSRKLLCLYCDRSFVSTSLRQKHVERCHSEKQSRRLSSRKLQSQFTTTACFHCDKLPVEHSLRQLFEHLVSAHSQKYFGCLLCEERFLNQLQLNDHNAKLHDTSEKKQLKPQSLINENEESDGSERAIKASNTVKSKVKEQQNKVKKKKSTNTSKPPSRQLRKRKKTTVKTSKVGLKRSKRLQSAHNKVPVRNKKSKAMESAKSEESTSKATDKVKTNSVNPYPEFDNYYRVKKITDHSIDNLKISSLTFDDVFDKAFFNRIKCNIQENLLYHLDGKLFKNEESESRISNFEKNPPTQDVPSNSSENFGCDLSLNAVTPVTSILASNFGEDLESQIEYGSKPSKKKLQIRQDPVRHKYVTRRKYQASIREHKENRDLSKLDMWTQLIIKDRQQKVMNGQKSAKEILEYTSCTEYKLKIQRNELNRILDRRGPFEDLKEEASKKAALEQLNLDFQHEINEECFKEVRSLMEDLLTEVAKNCSIEEKQSSNYVKSEKTEFLEKEDIPELPDYLQLRRTSSAPSEEEIDKSDKIALICSSQETENYELPTNTVRSKDEMVELSGEWARSRIYVCAACGLKVSNMKLLIDHKSVYHQNSWVQHYEMVGNQSELYRHLCIPGLGKVGHVEETVPCKLWVKSESRVCTKCGKVCNSLSELHRHILECGGDWTWMLARKKCKYRPFGARKKRRGLVKRIRVSNQKTDQAEKKKYKRSMEGPRQRPSDADTIQRMLANLPPKRSSRKSICMKDGFPRNRQTSPKNKKQVMKCGKIVRHKSTYNTNPEAVKNTSNHKNTSVRRTLRNISRTLSSKILDTTSKLKVKRQLINKMNRRSPRKNSSNVSDTNNDAPKSEEKVEKKTVKRGNIDKTKCVLKDKVNMKTFFPVSKRKTSRTLTKPKENKNSDLSNSAINFEQKSSIDSSQNKPKKSVLKLIKKPFNLNKKAKTNDVENRNSEPIVIIEKLPQNDQPEKNQTSKKIPSKRKLKNSFRKVIDKVKKLKLDNAPSTVNEINKEINMKPSNSFLGQGAREKEKLATVLVPIVEESKEKPTSNLAFVQNVMDNNSPTEESLIPENIFNLQHNSEDLLQAKSPMESLTHEAKTSETMNYFNAISAKVSKIVEYKNKDNKTTGEELKMKEVPLLSIESAFKNDESDVSEVAMENHEKTDGPSKTEGMSLLSIETAAKSGKSPLPSPILSPSMLSPRMKGKIRKPNRGLNDCIAMLTKKAFEETHKNEVVDVSTKTGNLLLDNIHEAHKITRTNECILKIPVIESNTQIQSEVLDLSKPKQTIDIDNSIQQKVFESTSLKPIPFWNPVEMCSSQPAINNVKILPSKPITEKQNPNINPVLEKAILKIPKFVEISRSNNVDNIIQGVIENYDEPVANADSKKSYLRVPSVGLMNSIDKIIEEVVKGKSKSSSNEEEVCDKQKPANSGKSVTEVDNTFFLQNSKSKKVTKKKKQVNQSPKDEISITEVSQKTETVENRLELPLNEDAVENKVPQIMTSLKENMQSDSLANEMNSVELQSTSNAAQLAGNEVITSDVPANHISIEPLINDDHVNISIHEKIIPADEELLEKKTDKKIGGRRKKSTKKTSKKSSNKVKVQSKNEKLEEHKNELNTTINDILPKIIQIDEPDVLEEKKIAAKDVDSGCLGMATIKTKDNKGLLNSSESSELQVTGVITDAINDCTDAIEKTEHTEKNTDIELNDLPATKLEQTNKLEIITPETKSEIDLKSNTTDSEDELPLLILKTRNKNNDAREAADEIGNIVTTENERKTGHLMEYVLDNVDELSEEENKEKHPHLITEEQNDAFSSVNKSDIHEQNEVEAEKVIVFENLHTENIANIGNISEKTSSNFPILESPKISEVPIINSGFNKKNNKTAASKTSAVRRKSPRKTSSSVNETAKNTYGENKPDKISDKSTFPIPEVLVNENIVKNTSDLDVENSHEISENEIHNDFLSEKISTDISAIKPKNFLVDASMPLVTNNMKNSSVLSLKSNKHKKKDKNKHDSIRKKLIVKFPKIILKEPVLRIPPREVSDNINFRNEAEKSQDLGIKLILDNPFANIKDREEKFSTMTNIPINTGKSADNDKHQKISKKKNSKHRKKYSKAIVSVDDGENATEKRLGDIVSSNFQPIIDDTHTTGQEMSIMKDKFSSHSTNVLEDASASSDQPNFNNKSQAPQPIKLKLISNSVKKTGVKNSKKKKYKSRKGDLTSTIELTEIPNLKTEGTEEIIELSTDIIEHTDKMRDNSGIEFESNDQIDQPSKNEFGAYRPAIQQDEVNGLKTNSTTKFESEENVLVKTGRNLRSSVKITHKQSNIFEIITDSEESSDMKATRKSELPRAAAVFSSKIQQEKETDAVIESYVVQHENIVDELDTTKNVMKKAFLDKISVAETMKSNHQQQFEVLNSVEKLNDKNLMDYTGEKSEKELVILIEDNTKMNLSELNTAYAERSTKSKKAKKSLHSKRPSNKSVNTNTNKESKKLYTLNISGKVESKETMPEKNNLQENLELVNESQTSNKISDMSLTQDILEECEYPHDISEEKPLETFAFVEKDEDLSSSEGELVINESFEGQEIINSEESTEVQEEMIGNTFRSNNTLQGNQKRADIDFTCTMQQGTQKTKKNTKSTPKKPSNIGNPILPTVEHTSSEEESPVVAEDFSNLTEIKETYDIQLSSQKDLKLDIPDSSKITFDSTCLRKNNTEKDTVESSGSTINILPVSNSNEKIELVVASSVLSDTDLQMPLLNTPRRQRMAKSKALENINIIEKKLDQILGTNVSQIKNQDEKLNQHNKSPKKSSKHKETTMSTKISENLSKSILKDENVCQINDYLTQRKTRAAKSKAIQNIKVLETKVNDNEDINRKPNEFYDKNAQKKKPKCKEDRRIDSEIKDEEAELPILSSFKMISSVNKEVFGSHDDKIIEMEKETKQCTFNKLTTQSSEFKSTASEFDEEIEKNEVFEGIYEGDEIIKFDEKIVAKHKEYTEPNKEKKFQRNTDASSKTDNVSSIDISWDNTRFGEKLDVSKNSKANDDKHGAFDVATKNDEIDCYDIANIDADKNLKEEETISLSPLKRKLRLEDTKENFPKSSLSVTKDNNSKPNAFERNHRSLENEFCETDLADSLDVTLKTTVDEISSILMGNLEKTEIISATSSSVEVGELQTKLPKSFRNSCNGKRHRNEESQLSRIFNEKVENKKKRNRDSACDESLSEKLKTQNIGQTTPDMENKRRSKRACKVNTYNENDLAEAIFEKAVSEKEKTKKKKIENHVSDSSISNITTKANPTEISHQKKLNSEELFDLLKTTVPDNLIALKPVEESPSNTPITDDNFDDQYDDILRKSQELFGEKPYKKIDDLCASDDSTSNSKLTDFEKLEENIELSDFLNKTPENLCGDTNSINSIDIPNGTSEPNTSKEPPALESSDLYCDICKKSFKRIDNLVKHRTTLTHIAKLSELEAKQAQSKSNEKGQISSDIIIDDNKPNDSGSYSFTGSTGNDALQIAEIMTKVLEKPAEPADRGFAEVINPLPEYRRYKSLGERKSFEYDQDSPNIPDKTDMNHYEPKISKNTGVLLEKQITLLQNIVGLECENSNSSYRSLGNTVGNTSPVSDISTKLDDSTNFQFPADSDGATRELRNIDGFLKPSHVEEVSEDSVHQRNPEDLKARKVLNRDEELFLECCSLLKSGSEVSNFSRRSNKNSFLNNISVKMTQEPDILESKKVIYKVSENSSDYSRRPTPLGDSFGDTSNSNTISSSWELCRSESPKTTGNFFNFNAADVDAKKSSPEFKNSENTTKSTEAAPTKQRMVSMETKMFPKTKNIFYRRSPNMRTKGAMKIFEGLKVSIQASDSKLCMLKKNLSARNQGNRGFEEAPSDKNLECPKTLRRKSKPIKNKQQIDDRFIFKVNKKSISKDTDEIKSQSPKDTSTDKISDVYDFEETQDNSDVFAKPDFKSFRFKGSEPTKVENCVENNFEAQTMSSSSSSNLSSKKSKANECITKNKHMIMGRIFRNAVKPKLDEDIRDIPTIDHNQLVENYVQSCTPKHEEVEFKKPKMTEEEMNYLFDKLLDKPAETHKKSCSSTKAEPKNTVMKKKIKLKCKKRQRSNSDSTDDEFGLNKIVKKRPSRKNAKEEDNSINLEQELKECIGVASRKSQRKCTSGKQNVLVEYWSSDESAFETFLENHLQELSEKSDLPKQTEEKLEKTEAKESLSKVLTCEKSKKTKSKPKTSAKRKGNKELLNESTEMSVQSNRRKRTAAHPLYHWSSSSEDELQDLIEVKSLRDDPEDEYDEERPIQHGWIVGDSPKKLVTMLAQAKGKKTESESLVKEQGKKKTANS